MTQQQQQTPGQKQPDQDQKKQDQQQQQSPGQKQPESPKQPNAQPK